MTTLPMTPWRQYPFRLVADGTDFDFPAAEGLHPGYESDTWYLSGDLVGKESGRRWAFLTIYNRNRPGGTVVADFYTMALFDLDAAEYGTFTEYDMPPRSLEPGATPKLSAASGHLEVAFRTREGTATWASCRDDDGQLMPYVYDVDLVGQDRAGAPMGLRLHVTPTRSPVPVGASDYGGKIECFGQADTFSYYQTGLVTAGSLRWGDVEEDVHGTTGHVDRQWFPLYAGGGGTSGAPRSRSHEWHTISLDNGVDLSIWRQFDRTARNAPQPFWGATTNSGDGGCDCAEDVVVGVDSYVRWPQEVRTLLPAPAPARYLSDRHSISSRALGLELTGHPLVPAPAHALPIEYMEGPFRYEGTYQGRPVSGFAIYERSLALYRDWELIDVLKTEVSIHPGLASMVRELRPFVIAGRRREARDYIDTALRPAIDDLAGDAAGTIIQIVDDLAQALAHDNIENT